MWQIEFAVMVVMIAINGVFAGYEIALASVAVTRLKRLAEEGEAGAARALYMKRNMEASLAVVQLGVTLMGTIAAVVGGAGAEEKLTPAIARLLGISEFAAEICAIVLIVIPLTAVTIIFGELIPKMFALRNPQTVCLRLSPFIYGFSKSVWPAVWLLEAAVKQVMALAERCRGGRQANAAGETAELHDLRAVASLARASRLISHREEGIILGATEMQQRQVCDIMLPAEHISSLPADGSMMDNLIAAHLDMHTRFPVVERQGDPQTVLGYVNVKDIIAAMHLTPGNASLRGIVRPLPAVDESLPLADCLDRLMHAHTHIAQVRDHHGRVTGLISIEDILEELVGEIEDEYDRLPGHLVPSGSAWVAGGGISLERLAAAGIDLLADLPEIGATTLSDWLTGHLARSVRGGDIIERGRVRIVVRKVRRKKVQEAQISLLAGPEGMSRVPGPASGREAVPGGSGLF